MTDASNEGGAPLGVLSDDERARFGEEGRLPPNPPRIFAGGVAGCAGLLFGAVGVGVLALSVETFLHHGVVGIAGIVVAIPMFMVSRMFWQLAWRWMHGLPLSMASATPAERRRLLEMGEPDLIVPKPTQTLMRPTKTIVPATTTAELTKKQR